MKKILTAVLTFSVIYSSAQDLIYDTKPYCNTADLIAKLLPGDFADRLKNSGCTDIYIFHLRPNACPRCEGVLFTAWEAMPASAACIFAVETGSTKAAQAYLRPYIKADSMQVIADTARLLRRIIDHSTTKLNVPFIYKIDLLTKEVIIVKPVLGATVNAAFIQELLTAATATGCVTSIEQKTASSANSCWTDSYPLSKKETAFEGYTSFSAALNTITFIESFSNQPVCFSRKGEYLSASTKDSTEMYRYIKEHIAEQALNTLVKKGVARNIYLTVKTEADEKNILISASLPDISVGYDSSSGVREVSYNNVPSIIHRNIQTGRSAITPLQYLANSNNMTRSHGELYFADSSYIIPLKKGWPAVGTSNNLLQQQEKNPFTDSFYHYCPTAEITTDTGSIGQFGRLPQFYISHKLGYYYNYISAAHSSSHLALVEKTTGTIQLYSIASLAGQQSPLCTFSIFEEKLRSIAPRKPEDFASPMDYLNSFEKELFRSYILDCLLDETNLHLLVKEENKLLYLNYSLNGKLLKKRQYPLQYPASLKQCRLISENNKLLVLGIEQYGNQYSINYLPIN